VLAAAASLVALLATGAQAATPSPCSRVSAAAVSAIVGYKVPAPIANTTHLPAVAKDHFISSVETSCTYGPQKTLPEIEKAVTLQVATTSKALSIAGVKKNLAAEEKTSHAAKWTINDYHGLGVPAVYVTLKLAGLTGQVITAVSGTHTYGAVVESSHISLTQLASLARLAAKL